MPSQLKTTGPFTISTTPRLIKAPRACHMVLVKEDPDAETKVGLKKYAPTTSNAAVPFPAGVPVDFLASDGGFAEEEEVGYVAAKSGTCDIYIEAAK